LASGNFNGDSRDDLAIGVPGEAVGSQSAAGSVNVLHGGLGGLSALVPEDLIFDQDSIAGYAAHAGDRFGSSLAVGQLDALGVDELVIGVIGEDTAGGAQAGAVAVLFGTSGQLSAAGSMGFDRETEGVQGPGWREDRYGLALAIGDFEGQGRPALVVSFADTRSDSAGPVTHNFGAIQVFYQGPAVRVFKDGFESGDLSAWH
jgi:hypothetical protein